LNRLRILLKRNQTTGEEVARRCKTEENYREQYDFYEVRNLYKYTQGKNNNDLFHFTPSPIVKLATLHSEHHSVLKT